MAGRKHLPIQLTLDDARKPTGHGGWRPGAGRKRKSRRGVTHDARPVLKARYPVLVTMRIAANVPNLRRRKLVHIVRAAIAESHKDFFRIIEFSVQGNHIHVIVEATDAGALSRGMGGLETRIAKRLNTHLGRSGDVFADRYHERILTNPRQVRNALRYVLLNARHHMADNGAFLGETWFDPCSSAAWFKGWRTGIPLDEAWKRELAAMPPPTRAPTQWLLTVGWRHYGLIALDEEMR